MSKGFKMPQTPYSFHQAIVSTICFNPKPIKVTQKALKIDKKVLRPKSWAQTDLGSNLESGA